MCSPESVLSQTSVLVIGRAVWDDWQDLPEAAPNARFGGAAANVAIHLARLGVNAELLTSFGSDSFSSEYEKRLQNVGVSVSRSIRVLHPLPRVRSWWTKQVYIWDQGAWLHDLIALDVTSVLKPHQIAFFGDYPLSFFPVEKGTRVQFAAPQDTLKLGLTTVEDLLRHHWTCVFLNSEEAEIVSAHTCISSLSELRRETWLVTNGPNDTVAYVNGQISLHSPIRCNCVDPVGGGDAFAAGVVAALVRQMDLETAIRVGHICSSIIVQQFGCQSDEFSWQFVTQQM